MCTYIEAWTQVSHLQHAFPAHNTLSCPPRKSTLIPSFVVLPRLSVPAAPHVSDAAVPTSSAQLLLYAFKWSFQTLLLLVQTKQSSTLHIKKKMWSHEQDLLPCYHVVFWWSSSLHYHTDSRDMSLKHCRLKGPRRTKGLESIYKA